MGVAFTDAWAIFNRVINFFYDIKVIGNLPLGLLIIVVGVLGALITMIANYKR